MTDRLAAVDVACVDQTATVVVRGEIDIATADLLEQALQLACHQQPSRVLVDLREATFFGLTGLDLVIGIREPLARRGATVTVINPTPSVEKMMAVLGVSSLVGPGLVAVPNGPQTSRWRARRRRLDLTADAQAVVAEKLMQ